MKPALRVAALAALASTAWAHAGEPPEPHDFWTAWEFDPAVVIGLAVTAWLYWRGSGPPRADQGIRPTLFWTGWIALALALVSPLHTMGEALFSAHMTQHEVLMAVAAPLLALSRPGVRLLRGIPLPARRAVVRWTRPQWLRRPWHALSDPVSAWFLHAAALWVWHAPPLFQATLRSDWIHALQHISFLGSALLFWSALFKGRAAYGAGVVYVFSTAVHSGILGALLTFAPKIWYPAYASTTAAWGLTPLEDQQLGGLIMWVPAGVLYTVAGLWMLAEWMKSSEYRYAN